MEVADVGTYSTVCVFSQCGNCEADVVGTIPTPALAIIPSLSHAIGSLLSSNSAVSGDKLQAALWRLRAKRHST